MGRFLVLSVLCCGWVFGGDAPLVAVKSIPLPGIEGRMDHFAVDAKLGHLFLAALASNLVEVVDLAAGKVIHQITKQQEPQGVAFISETNELVVANGGDGSVRFYDASTWAPTAVVDLKDDADNLRYDAGAGVVYAGHGDGAITSVAVRSHQVVSTMPLTAHPEAFALETDGPRIFVNVPNAHHVAVLDRMGKSVVATWDLAKGFPDFFAGANKRPASNFPMAIDAVHQRVVIGCRKPACLVVFDSAGNRPVATIEIAGDVDDIFYDSAAKRFYAICGEGFVDVIDQIDADHYSRSAQIPTGSGARTGYWTPDDRRLYVAVPHRREQSSAILVFQAKP